jgi:hypothetical protein
MTTTAAIATKLNVLESAIVRIEEWAHVMFVVVKGLGARFVSKKYNVEKMELLQLEGSAKQVAWAEDIRSKSLQLIEEIIESLQSGQKWGGYINPKAMPLVLELKELLILTTSAKWFIDRKQIATKTGIGYAISHLAEAK